MYICELISFDLWGNSKDGYEINDMYTLERDIVISDEIINDDKLLIKALKKLGFIKKTAKNSKFIIDGEPAYSLYIDYYDMPVFELRTTKYIENDEE